VAASKRGNVAFWDLAPSLGHPVSLQLISTDNPGWIWGYQSPKVIVTKY
jgi:hypothetical protein